MALDIRTKLALQKEASKIKKELTSGAKLNIKDKIALQKRWSAILKQLKGKVDDKGKDIAKAANEAATGDNNQPEPTEGQKVAGNYKKGRITLAGLDITIENPKGSTRSGKSKDGVTWSITMQHHYGDFAGTKGADGDPVDVFIGEATDFKNVYIVDQVDNSGAFDEHKVMFGFDTMAQAKAAYLANYKKGWDGLGDITSMPIEQFKKWIYGGVKSKPAGDLATKQVSFLDEYRGGKFFNLEPLAFKQLILQAGEEGLSLDDNKDVVSKYLNHYI